MGDELRCEGCNQPIDESAETFHCDACGEDRCIKCVRPENDGLHCRTCDRILTPKDVSTPIVEELSSVSEGCCTTCGLGFTPADDTQVFDCPKCKVRFCALCVETIPGDKSYVRCRACTSVIIPTLYVLSPATA